MADWNEPRRSQTGFGASPAYRGEVVTGETVDAGLRQHMLSIYNYMTSGVLLTGIVAALTASSGLAAQMQGSPIMWLIILSPLAIVFAMSFGANKFSKTTLQAMFWVFATAAAFAGLSLFGYTTKKDLSGIGSFLIMGVVGLIVAMVINIFLQSPALMYAISFIGVLIFAGLTAYDTQRLKEQYAYVRGTEFAGKAVVLGALTLYLDFINMFQFLLSFMGQRD